MKIKLLNENAKVPTRATDDAAGYDLYAAIDDPNGITIAEGETKLVSTGISIEIPKGYFGAIFPRSGLSVKRGLTLANCVGVIDSDYRGPVQVALYRAPTNTSLVGSTFFGFLNKKETVYNGDRIAQLVILPYYTPEFEVVSELSETNRGSGGFGSTGT